MLEKIRQIFSRMKKRLPSKNKEEPELDGFGEPDDLPEQKDPTLTQKLNDLISKLKSVKKSDLIDPFVEYEESKKATQKKFSLSNMDFASVITYLNSPKFYTEFHYYFIIVFMVLSFYTLGKITALFVRGDVPSGVALKSINVDFDTSRELQANHISLIKKTNPFNTGTPKKVDEEKLAIQQKCDQSEQVTSLPLTLRNTIVLQDSVKSIASIQVRSKEVEDFRQGEEIPGVAKIERIERLRIILKNLKTGACEFAENKEFEKPSNINVLSTEKSKAYIKTQSTQKGIKNEGNNFTIDRSLINEKMQDISSILTQAKATPFKNPDGTMAFKLDQVEPGGIFATLGIQNGDTITKINGKSIESVNEVMKLFQDLTNLPNVNLTINRDGSEENLDYSIK